MQRSETATLPSSELRVATDANGAKTVSGLIPYNSQSVDLGGFTEIIAPGAFSDALKAGADVLALRDHDAKILLGRTKANTLRLTDSPEGLRYAIVLPNTTQGNDLAESITRGDLDSTSFGFQVLEDKWTATADNVLRTLVAVDLLEVSPCSFAAYPDSKVSIRTAPKDIKERIKPVSDLSDSTDNDTEDEDDEDRSCTCQCDACSADNCADCTTPDCDADGCTCPSSQDDPDDVEQDSVRHYMAMTLAYRSRL